MRPWCAWHGSMNTAALKDEVQDLFRPSPWSGRIAPFFQPIVDLDTLNVYGYEQLGRVHSNGEYSSLGPLFQSVAAGGEQILAEALSADLELQMQGMLRFRDEGEGMLFININPRLLEFQLARKAFQVESFPLVRIARACGVEPSRIVLEITEEEFAADRVALGPIVQALKEYGFLLAVDDLGAKMSGLSRLALLEPDIIKVDLEFMRRSRSHGGFRKLLTAIAFIADRLGATLLFEGIEQEEELMGALQMGGRLVQGYFFSKPEIDFGGVGVYQEQLRPVLDRYTQYRIAELVNAEQMLDQSLQGLVDFIDGLQIGGNDEVNDQLQRVLGHAPPLARQMTIFDSSGNQISSSFVRVDGGWNKDNGPRRNISWRAFFQKTLASYRSRGRRYNVSEPYQESRSGDLCAMIALVISDDHVLLVEVDWIE